MLVVCMNASYLPRDYGISVTLTVNGLAIINETLSGKLDKDEQLF